MVFINKMVVSDPRMPILLSALAARNPRMVRSTMNAVMSLVPVPVRAYTTRVSACGAFVIQNLLPLRTYRSPWARACRRIETTSDPAPASLIASAPTCSPLISLGR